MKTTYNLYRVSTKKQVHKGVDNIEDIPMQRQACREFANRMGWAIGKEFEKKAFRLRKSPLMTGTRSRTSRTQPLKVSFRYYWFLCLTG